MTIRKFSRAVLRTPLRVLFPEGTLLVALLILPSVPEAFAPIRPLIGLVFGATAAAVLAVGWRFARGRPVQAMALLAAAAFVPLLPPGPARTLTAILIPLNLAVLAFLPERGILTRVGLLRLAALAVQAGVIAGLVMLLEPGAADPLAGLTLPGLTTTGPAVVASAAAILSLTTLAAISGSAPARGMLWATVATLAIHQGFPGGGLYIAAAGGLVLLVATLEDAHALAYRDALTGLRSRRALDELLQRSGRRYTVAMVDVDHFKTFNDRHGHEVGDQVLRMVAARLREAGGGARAFRYGGEEFTLVFRGRSVEQARPYLDAVRQAIENAEFIVRRPNRPKKKPRRPPPKRPLKKLSVTVSIGAAQRVSRSQPGAEVVKAADAAMYQAKEGGRNKVVAGAA